MATVIPPPSKRQKTAVAEKAREQQSLESIPDDLGNLRVQFVDQSTGQAIGATVSVPVIDTSVKNLELLLNTIQGHVSTVQVCLHRVLNRYLGSLRTGSVSLHPPI